MGRQWGSVGVLGSGNGGSTAQGTADSLAALLRPHVQFRHSLGRGLRELEAGQLKAQVHHP